MVFSREQYKTGQHALTPAQLRKLLLSFTNIQEKGIIALTASIGLRREDVVQVLKNDLAPFYDSEGRLEGATLTYYEHKKKRTRTVFIPSLETVQILIMHIDILNANPLTKKNKYMFPSPKGGKFSETKHVSSRQVFDTFNEHLDMIKLPRRPFHSLRATCYKLCQENGWSPRKACELIGDSLRVAEDHYNAPSQEEMRTISKEKPIF